jgi:hypothetical protein
MEKDWGGEVRKSCGHGATFVPDYMLGAVLLMKYQG